MVHRGHDRRRLERLCFETSEAEGQFWVINIYNGEQGWEKNGGRGGVGM